MVMMIFVIISGAKTGLVAVAAKVAVLRQQTSITPATSPDQGISDANEIYFTYFRRTSIY